MQEDVKEKENSIDESHKIITKLKDEYQNLYKMYNSLDNYAKDLVKENELSKKSSENYNRMYQLYEKEKKKSENLFKKNEELRNENNAIRKSLINQNNDRAKNEKDVKDKELIISDLKERTENWIAMIKERDQIILESNKKIKELNELIGQKDEQLKVMVNFSKEINNENKSNVAELTKQAVKTIKIFYNTLNNSNKEQIDSAFRIIFENNNTTFADFEPIFKAKKVSFMIEDALNGLMYIPLDLKSINKEFLMDMNLKTELIKSELYSGLIRESNFVTFLEDVFVKLNFKDSESIETLCSRVIALKTHCEMLQKENEDLRKSNIMLLENKREFDLYTKKLKEDMKKMLDRLKEKFGVIEKGLELQLAKAKGENRSIREKFKKEVEKLKGEIALLNSEKENNQQERDQLKKALDDQKMSDNLFNPQIIGRPMVNWNQVIIPNAGVKFSIVNQFGSNSNSHHKRSSRVSSASLNQNQSFHSDHSVINDSFNEKNYRNKKKEINNLKDELSKIKSEMANLIQNPNKSTISAMDNIGDGIEERQRYESELQDERRKNNQLRNVERELQEERKKNIQLRNVENELQEEIRANNQLRNEIENLKKHCNDLVEKLSDKEEQNQINPMDQMNPMNQINQMSQISQIPVRDHQESKFTPQLFIKLFFDLNAKLFSSSELKKFYSIYNANNIVGIIEIFGKNCDIIKREIYGAKFDLDTSYTDLDETFLNSRSAHINNSYRLVNDRIVRLKKFEFDFINLNEFLKNYLIAQEIVIKMCFSGADEIQFEPIEHLYKLFEDCLNYKIDDMSDDIIFNRKVILRYAKNQKNCLGLSLEYSA